jgi:hypothetical protein
MKQRYDTTDIMQHHHASIGIKGTHRFCSLVNFESEPITTTTTCIKKQHPSCPTKCRHPPIGIFLYVDDTYTRSIIHEAFLRYDASYFQIQFGPGIGMEPIPLPDHCHFQWSEYERIDWDAVLAGNIKLRTI